MKPRVSVSVAPSSRSSARGARVLTRSSLTRPDTDPVVAVTYAGSARIEVGFEPATVATTGLARYLIDLEGKRIVFDAGFFSGDFSSDPPKLIEHGLKRYEEVICGALA